jgi:hypothetical protein
MHVALHVVFLPLLEFQCQKVNIWGHNQHLAPQMGLIKTGPGLINPQMLILRILLFRLLLNS